VRLFWIPSEHRRQTRCQRWFLLCNLFWLRCMFRLSRRFLQAKRKRLHNDVIPWLIQVLQINDHKYIFI
jgi:hypothetical protein